MPSWFPWHSWVWWQQAGFVAACLAGFGWGWLGHSSRFVKYDAPKNW